MLLDYDKTYPKWSLTEDYNDCRNLTEKKILRVVLTWLDFVRQRYTKKQFLRLDNYFDGDPGCLRGKQAERQYKWIANAIPDDRDPAHFVSYVFESWKNRENLWVLTQKELDECSGIAFPSLKFMCLNAEQLVKVWLAIRDYKPKGFVPEDDFRERDTKIVENKIHRWCAAHDKTPADFWCFPQEVMSLDSRYMKYSTSLPANRKAVEEYWDCTVEQLILFMEGFQGAMQSRVDKTFLKNWAVALIRKEEGLEPEYPNLFILEGE